MTRRNAINALLVAAAAALIAVFAFALRVQPVPDRVAVLDVPPGMENRCSGELRKTLQGEEGVAGVNMIPGTNRIGIAFHSASVDREAMRAWLGHAGFASAPLTVMTTEEFAKLTGTGVHVLMKRHCSGGCGN